MPDQIKPSLIKSLTMFFPAHNEERNIAETVQKADRVARKLTADFEIIVVNDGSTDQTPRIVEDRMPHYPALKLINHPKNQCYGAALRTGFDAATKEWIFFSDADLQFDLEEIDKLVEFADQYPVIIGFRQNRSEGFMRTLNAWGWRMLNRIFFDLRESRDIDCAFKLMKASAIKPILPQIISRGAMFSAEMLIRLKQAGFKLKQVPVTHYPRRAGRSSGAHPKVILRALKEMWQVKVTLDYLNS